MLCWFLGANGADGFGSLYDGWVDQTACQAFYVLKGGAGCGKSTLMRRVAARLEKAGWDVEYILCSGDPGSLDGVRIPGKGAALVDGTAPHVVEPAFVGATGHYLDLGDGYDRAALFPQRAEIVRLAQTYKAAYRDAWHCLRAAEEARARAAAPLHTEEVREKLRKRAGRLLHQLGRQKGIGRRTDRFLGGPTCEGPRFLDGTVRALCGQGWLIRDEVGLVPALLAQLEAGLREAGWDVIACPDPLRPSRLAQLLVPELGVCFLTQDVEGLPLRPVRTESVLDKTRWQEVRGAVRLAERAAQELEAEAVGHLRTAKERHDELEALYRPHVDFSLAEALTERTAAEILALPDV